MIVEFIMSDVNLAAPLPTPSFRSFSWNAVVLRGSNVNTILSRDPHTANPITQLSLHYSRATLHELRAEVVFAPQSLGLIGQVFAAWTHGNRSPTTVNEIMELPDCTVITFGSSVSATPSTSFFCDFNTNFASTLIKPAPVEGARARLVLVVQVASISDGQAEEFDKKSLSDRPILSVYVKGKVSFSGAE